MSSRTTVCFFFQAEDGIRDLIVTGVQTCALPIYPHMREELQPAGKPALRLAGSLGRGSHFALVPAEQGNQTVRLTEIAAADDDPFGLVDRHLGPTPPYESS